MKNPKSRDTNLVLLSLLLIHGSAGINNMVRDTAVREGKITID
jgi:hypothetical protein